MTTVNIWVLILTVWVACGILAAGYTFAYFQGEYADHAEFTRRADQRFATMMGLSGPIGLGVAYFAGRRGRYGWRLR